MRLKPENVTNIMVMITTKETKRIILHNRKLKRELTTNDVCENCEHVGGVYTDVLFAEDRGLSPCLGERGRGYKQCNGDCILTANRICCSRRP